MMPRWEEVRTSGIADAARVLNARRDAEVLPGLIAAWSDTVLARLPTPPENLAALPETVVLAEAFDRRGLGAVAEALRLIDQREGAIPPGRWLLARLVGVAEGDRFADGLASDARRPLALWSLESYGAWEAFTDSLSARLFEAERSSLVPYTGRFEGFHPLPASVSKTCLVRFGNNKYSLLQESVRAFYTSWNTELVIGLPKAENGMITISDVPGLGLELLPALAPRTPGPALNRSRDADDLPGLRQVIRLRSIGTIPAPRHS